jgi:hypothetical protein
MLAPARILRLATFRFLFHERTATILETEVLRNLTTIGVRSITTSIRVAACVLSVAMLLSFPVTRAHSFGQHFGTTEIRHNIVRHTFVAGPETCEVDKISHIDALPAVPTTVIVENLGVRLSPDTVASELPTFRIVHHFKLGPSRSGASDPLI